MKLGYIQTFQELVCLIEVFFRLSSSTHNHIYPDERMRHHFLDFLNLMSEQSRIVTSTHQLQHLITTTLQRNMEVWHECTGLGYVFNDFIGQQVRFNGRDTITFDTFHLVKRLHQIEEGFSGSLSKVADVHPGNDYFLTAFGCCLTGLRYNVFNFTVTTSSTGKRNGTIGTEIITSVLHLQEIAGTVASRTGRSKTTDILKLTGYRFTLFMLLQITQEIHDTAFLFSSQYHIHSFNGSHLFRFQLGIASSHHHKGPRMILYQPVNGLTAFLVGHFCYRTSIDHTNIRLLPSSCRTDTRFLQQLANGRGFREIQLAAQCIIYGCLILKYSSIYHISLICSTKIGIIPHKKRSDSKESDLFTNIIV